MPVRKTSIEAYKAIQENGLLRGQELLTYNALYRCGPASSMEVYEDLEQHGEYKSKRPQTGARLNALRERGCIEEVGERHCRVTGENVIIFDVTDRIPEMRESAKDAFQISAKEAEFLLTSLRAWFNDTTPGATPNPALVKLEKWLERKVTKKNKTKKQAVEIEPLRKDAVREYDPPPAEPVAAAPRTWTAEELL